MRTSKYYPILILISILLANSSAWSQDLNLLPNPGFEEKSLALWTMMDSCKFQLSDFAKHSGKRSLAFYPQREGAGIRTDVAAILQPGYCYLFTGWFRNVEAGWGQVDVLLSYQQAGQTKQIVIGRADCNKDIWTNLSNQFAIPAQAEPSSLQLVIKTSWGLIAFLVDDLELRPALQMQIAYLSTSTEPSLTFQIGPHQDQRNSIRVTANLFDSGCQSVKQLVQPLDNPLQPSLPNGFYHAVAGTKDLDGRLFTAEKIVCIGTLAQLTQTLDDQANAILSISTLARYHGWIHYLQYLASFYQRQDGGEAERTQQALYRLSRWAQTIQKNPAALDTLTGVQEWAYLSKVDDSGQPFKIAIPTGYNAHKTYPLVVVMHGYGGNHMEYSGGVVSNPDYFELHVLGRARGGGYNDLSEADVLDAVDYVCANWQIDNRRIHLTGASMGGGGTFKMAARYPDRWASGRPVCGYGNDQPILNSLHVPLYSTHSQDDPSVPVLTSRAPLQKLLAAGGQVIIDETNGLQHAAWNYAEGNNRAQQWSQDQVRLEIRTVRQIDYTAIDRYACSAYWLKVAEWGKLPGVARFKATAGLENQLYLDLDNIRTLQIQVPKSPFNPQQQLRISVNGRVFITVKAPLPDSIFVTEENGIWSAKTDFIDRLSFTLHTPGGVHNLYHHEPLLIVYGTGGDETARQALAQAAVAASKSVHPMWVGDEGDIKDGVPNHQLLYGHLKIKPDTAVTAADLKKYHMVVIGKADENRLVQKMQSQLPVQFGTEIVCSDGVRLPGEAAIMGLYFYNPLAPDKLIYWVAAANPSAYRPYNFLFQLQNDNPIGIDLLVVQENPPKIVKARYFDSRWHWSDAFNHVAKITAAENTFGKVFEQIARAIRITSGADFALQAIQAPPDLQAGVLGLTQWSDFAAVDLTTPIAMLTMTGDQILSYQQDFLKAGNQFFFFPAVDDKIVPEKTYRIALMASYYQIQQLVNLKHQVPDSFEILDLTLFTAMKQVLF